VFCVFAVQALSSAVASASVIHCSDSRLSDDDWVSKHLSSSAFVALASVTDSRDIPRPADPEVSSTGSMKELLERIEEIQKQQYFSNEAVLLIEKIWKGPADPRLRVFYNTSPGQYGFKLAVGEQYLFFGHVLADGRYSISTVCDGAVLAENALAKMKVLDELIARKKTQPEGWG